MDSRYVEISPLSPRWTRRPVSLERNITFRIWIIMEYVDDGMVILRLLGAYQGAIFLFNVSVCHMQKEHLSLGLYLTRKCNLHASYHSPLEIFVPNSFNIQGLTIQVPEFRWQLRFHIPLSVGKLLKLSSLKQKKKTIPKHHMVWNGKYTYVSKVLFIRGILHIAILILVYVINSWQSMQQDIRLWFAAVCLWRSRQLNTYSKMSIAWHKIVHANNP